MRLRPLLLQIHLWLSFAVGGVFVVAAGTGAVLTFQHEIDAWLNRGVRYAVTPGDVGFEQIERTVRAAHPDHRLDLLWFPRWNIPTYEAYLERGGEYRSVHLDPGTGRFLPEAQPASRFVTAVQEIHTTLLGGTVGWWVVVATTVASVVILLTGLYLWWPGLRRLAHGFQLRLRRTTYILNYDLHRVAGILAALPLLLMCLTGLVMAFPEAGRAAVHALFLQRPSELKDYTEVRSAPPPPGWSETQRPSQAELLRRAHAEVPGASTFYVTWPATPDEPVHVRLQTGIEPKPFGIVTRLSYDQYTGELIQVVDPRRMSAPEAVVQHWNDRLHFGDFAGVGSKLLYLLACLAGVGLVVTGFVVWWLKRVARQRTAARQRPTPVRPHPPAASFPRPRG